MRHGLMGPHILSARADCTNNFQQPYENSTAKFLLHCISQRPAAPPHPFDNDIATSYRTSAISPPDKSIPSQ